MQFLGIYIFFLSNFLSLPVLLKIKMREREEVNKYFTCKSILLKMSYYYAFRNYYEKELKYDCCPNRSIR